MRNKNYLFLLLIGSLIITSGYAFPTKATDSLFTLEEMIIQPEEIAQEITTDSIETKITIDGISLDWENYEILLTDPQGDNDGGKFDIKSLRAFSNNKFLYILIETHQPPDDYVQVDLDISVGESTYIITFQPQNSSSGFMGDMTNGDYKEIGNLAGSQSAVSTAVELKLPLSAFNDHSNIRLGVRPMAGTCCESPDWYVIDEVGLITPNQLDEIEPKQDLTIPAKSPGASLVIEQKQVDLSAVRGDEPTDLVMTKDGKRIYTVGRNTDTLFVIDGTTNQITNIVNIEGITNNPYGTRPDKLALSADEKFLLIANFNDNSISIFNTSSLKVTQTVSIMPQPCDVAISNSGDVFAVSRIESKISKFNLDDPKKIDYLNIPIPAFALAVDSEGSVIYAASAKGIYVVDMDSLQIIRLITLPINGYMGNILLNRDGSKAFVSMRDTNQVLQIDLENDTVSKSYEVNAAAEGLALNANEDKLYVGTFTALIKFDYTVAVIDLINETISGKIMPLSPAEHVSWVPVVEGLAVNPDGKVYFATEDADAVFIADSNTFQHIATIPLTDFARLQPVRLSISTDGKWLYTANAAPQAASISIISTINQQARTYYYDDTENDACIAKTSGVDISSNNGFVYISAGKCLLTFNPEQESFIEEFQLDLPNDLYLTDLKVHPNGKLVYLLDNGGGLTSVDLATMKPTERLDIMEDAFNLKINNSGNQIFITGNSNYAIVDTKNYTVIKTENASFMENKQFSKYPNRLIGLDPKQQFYLIGDFNSFSIFDLDSFQRKDTIALDQWSPHRQLATDAIFTPSGTTGYLALWDMKGIVAFNPDTWQLKAQIDTGASPNFVVCPDDFAISPDGSRLYVSGEQSDNILVIDTGSNQAIDVITLEP